MARPLRLEFSGACYHVTARGNRREAIFRDDSDRLRFIDLLAKEVGQQGWILYAFCLMDNHYHLLLETPEPNLVGGMRRLNGAYTQAFNRRHRLVGHLLQGRYKAILVDQESYLLELCRYVVLNPVRAKAVKSVNDWPWSSYLPTAGKMSCPEWLAADRVHALFGVDPAAAGRTYRSFVAQGLGLSSPWESVSGQIFLGNERFLKRMQGFAAGKSSRNVPRIQHQVIRPNAGEVIESVAHRYELKVKEVLDRSHPEAFKLAVYLLRRQANLTLSQTAEMAGISPPRVSQIQREIEAAKDQNVAIAARRTIK